MLCLIYLWVHKNRCMKKVANSNQKLFIGLLVGLLVGVVFTLYGLDYIPGGYKYASLAMIISFFLVAVMFLSVVILRDRIIKFMFGDVGDIDTFQSEALHTIKVISETVSDKLTTRLPKDQQQLSKNLMPKVVNYFIWGRVRNWWLKWMVTIFIAIGGLATTVLLINQNKLLESQNNKIDQQSALMTLQSNLMEADRRGAQVVLMGNVLQDLSAEIREEKINGKSDSTGYSLSAPLIGRIVATSQGFLPYKFLQDGVLTKEEYSLERGQLLLALINSRLDSNTQSKIFQSATFEKSYLPNLKIFRGNLRGVRMRGSYLKDAWITYTDLSDTSLGESDFTGANLSGCDLSGSNVHGANFAGAWLNNTTLRKTGFLGSNLQDVKFVKADLTGAYLSKTNATKANFEDAIMTGVSYNETNLIEVVNLTYEQLASAKLLYMVKGLPVEIMESLEHDKPCLMERYGCDIDD